MTDKRLFVGLPVSKELTEELSSIIQTFSYPHWNWTKPSNFHLTVCFIGNIPEEKVEEVISALSKIPKPSFAMEADKIIPVMRKGKLNMLWVVFKTNETFISISKEIHKALNVNLEREPKAHITLCRVKALNRESVSEKDFPQLSNTVLPVKNYILFESKSEGRGPTYIPLKILLAGD